MELGSLLNSVTAVLSSMLAWVGDVFETAVDSPITMFFLACAIIGVAVGFAKKLMHI